MKRVFAAILALVYLSVSTGVAVRWHTCMNRLISVGLSLKPPVAKCSNCGMTKKVSHGCCKDEHRVLPLAKDHKASETAFQFPELAAATLPGRYGEYSSPPMPLQLAKNALSHAPPGSPGPRLHLLHCTFLI